MVDPAAWIGQVLGDTYRITRVLGKGGMGCVLEAESTRLSGKRFAVKMLLGGAGADSLQRFRREADIATKLGHPHIVDVMDFNTTPSGQPYIVMEYLDGEDLGVRLQRGALPVDAVMRIVAEVCSALGAAHAAGVVHRDLKPQNIFLCQRAGRDDYVKIVDFGISKMQGAAPLTQDSMMLGTLLYMAPEQARGESAAVDARSDLFSLGAIVWEMLAGRLAFGGPHFAAVLNAVMTRDPQPLHEIRGDVPPAVSAAVARALAKSQAARTASAAQFWHELQAGFRHANPTVAAAAAVPLVTGRQARPRWPWLAVGGGAVAVLATVLLLVSGSRRDARGKGGDGSGAPSPSVVRPAGPLDALVPLADKVRAAGDAMIARKSTAEAFAPWPVLEDRLGASDLANAGARRTRLVSMELDIELAGPLLVKTIVAVDADRAPRILFLFMLENTTSGQPPERFTGDAAGLRTAAGELVQWMADERCPGLPLIDDSWGKTLRPPDLAAQFAKALATARQQLPLVCTRMRGMAPRIVQIRVDDIFVTVEDGSGNLIGSWEGELDVSTPGVIGVRTHQFRKMP